VLEGNGVFLIGGFGPLHLVLAALLMTWLLGFLVLIGGCGVLDKVLRAFPVHRLLGFLLLIGGFGVLHQVLAAFLTTWLQDFFFLADGFCILNQVLGTFLGTRRLGFLLFIGWLCSHLLIKLVFFVFQRLIFPFLKPVPCPLVVCTSTNRVQVKGTLFMTTKDCKVKSSFIIFTL